MKKKIFSILFLLALCSQLFAADTRVAGGATYGYLGQNLTWASGINSDFVMDSVSPATGVCLSVINNDSGSHTATLKAFTTSQLSLVTFNSNPLGLWTQVSIAPSNSGSASYTFAATSVTQLYIRTTAAAHVTLSFSAGSGAGTVTLNYAQTPSPCGSGSNQGTTIGGWAVHDAPAAANPCNTAAALVAGVPGIRHVVNCVSIALTDSGGTAAVATAYDIRDGGTAGSCAAGTIVWNSALAVSAVAGSSAQVAVCGLNIASTAGNSLQVCAEQTPAAGDTCKTSMSGVDTQ